MYLPTIDRPLWPCLVLLVVFIPVSLWHETHWKRTILEYAAARRNAGAEDAGWPDSEQRWVLSLQPTLLLLAAALLAGMVVFGSVAFFSWPRRVPGFNEVVNYFDRPYLAAMLTAGLAAVFGAVALAVDLRRSPWRGVAYHVRRAVHAPAQTRAALFSAALLVDPGVPHHESGTADGSGFEPSPIPGPSPGL
jgi:hypothetical protein